MSYPAIPTGFNTYCRGYQETKECESCVHKQNHMILSEFSPLVRKGLQVRMQEKSGYFCVGTEVSTYKPISDLEK